MVSQHFKSEGTFETPTVAETPKAKGPRAPIWVLVLCVIAALVGGGAIGRYVLTPDIALITDKTTLTEGELDGTVGSYYYGGDYHPISAREAIEATSSLDVAKLEDGTYRMPSADSVLNCARNQILAAEVASQGIEVTDEDLQTYMQDTLGTTDYDELATQYGMDVDQVKQMVRDSTGTQKLYEKIVGKQDAGEMPQVPETPEEGQEDTANATYGAYIVGLLGDNWDSANNTWANTDNDYYTALQNESFSADSATYNQAMSAYYVAYQDYTETASASTTQWTDYVNGLLARASLTIGELVS